MSGILKPQIVRSATSLNELIVLSGVDPTDRLSLDRLMAEFNALPFDIRKRLTDRDTTLPDVPQLAGQELDALASESRLFFIARQLHECFGDGRQITARGNPKLADCKMLAELLGTQDFVARSAPRSLRDMPFLDWIIGMSMHLGILEVQGNKMLAAEKWSRSAELKPFQTFKKAITKVCETAVLENDATPYDFFNWIDRYLNLNTVRICANLYRHGKGLRNEIGAYAFRQLLIPATDESLDMMNRKNILELIDMRFSRFLWCLTSLGIVGGPPVDHIPDVDNFSLEITALGACALEQPFRRADFILV